MFVLLLYVCWIYLSKCHFLCDFYVPHFHHVSSVCYAFIVLLYTIIILLYNNNKSASHSLRCIIYRHKTLNKPLVSHNTTYGITYSIILKLRSAKM